MRGLIVTPAGASAGETVVAAAIAATLSARGEQVATRAREGELVLAVGAQADVRDLAATPDLPLVIAARPGPACMEQALGAIESARAAGRRLAGVVLTPWPARPEASHRQGASTIERLGRVEVATLRYVPDSRQWTLARAGTALPVARWLAHDGTQGFVPRLFAAA